MSATGYYTVVLSLPTGLKHTSANPSPIEITNGALNAGNVNFAVGFSGQAAAAWSAVPISLSPIISLDQLLATLWQRSVKQSTH